jgi:hypothetical protein
VLAPSAAARNSAAAAGLGLRRLLRDAAWRAEQALHLGRGILLLALAAIVLLVWDLGRYAPPLVLATILALAVGWCVAAWALYHGPYRAWLPYLLVAIDGAILARLAIGVRFQEYFIPEPAARLAAADLNAVLAPLFVLLALSGLFRLSARLALYSGGVAIAGTLLSVIALELPARTAVAELIVVGLAGALGVRAARVLREVELRAEEELILERYVPEPLVTELVKTEDVGHHAGRLTPATLLMVDIRGFTTLSEALSPAAAVALLNEYFSTVLVPLTEQGGYLDQ